MAQTLEQKRAWYAVNREKVGERMAAYRTVHREEARKRAAAWRAEFPEKARENKAAWYAANKEKIAIKRAAYYVANRDKIIAYKTTYYADNKGKISTKGALYYAANREQKAKYRAAYYSQNRDKVLAREKARNSKPEVKAARRAYREIHLEKYLRNSVEWHKKNRKKSRQMLYAWRTKNPGAVRAISSKRRAQKLMQRCGCCSDAEITKIYGIAALCGPGAHVDHKTQLALGGHHCVKNLEALTAEEHYEKSKRDTKVRADSHRRNKLFLIWRRAV